MGKGRGYNRNRVKSQTFLLNSFLGALTSAGKHRAQLLRLEGLNTRVWPCLGHIVRVGKNKTKAMFRASEEFHGVLSAQKTI